MLHAELSYYLHWFDNSTMFIKTGNEVDIQALQKYICEHICVIEAALQL